MIRCTSCNSLFSCPKLRLERESMYDFFVFCINVSEIQKKISQGLWFYTCSCVLIQLIHTHTRTQPFYGLLSGTTLVGRYQKRHSPTHTWNVLWESVIILDFMTCEEDNRGTYTDNPAVPHSIQTIDAPTSIIPPILCRMPFLLNPPNLSWLGTCTKYAGWHTRRLYIANTNVKFHFFFCSKQ